MLKLNDKVIFIQNLKIMYLKNNEKKNVTTLRSTWVHRQYKWTPAKTSMKQKHSQNRYLTYVSHKWYLKKNRGNTKSNIIKIAISKARSTARYVKLIFTIYWQSLLNRALLLVCCPLLRFRARLGFVRWSLHEPPAHSHPTDAGPVGFGWVVPDHPSVAWSVQRSRSS